MCCLDIWTWGGRGLNSVTASSLPHSPADKAPQPETLLLSGTRCSAAYPRGAGFGALPACVIVQTSQPQPSTGTRGHLPLVLLQNLPSTGPAVCSLCLQVQPPCGPAWCALPSLDCECMWLVNCGQSNLSKVGCPVSTRPHNPRADFPLSSPGWSGEE